MLIKADCLIALSGGAGTLGEVAMAWNLLQMNLMPSTPVLLVGPIWASMTEAFRQHLVVAEYDLELLRLVATVDEAVAALNALPVAGAGN
jgi:predicted Rossmann-fold nucleotide-binding protein